MTLRTFHRICIDVSRFHMPFEARVKLGSKLAMIAFELWGVFRVNFFDMSFEPG